MRSPRLAAAALCLSALEPVRASATEFEVQANTALQGYQVAAPWGDVFVERRRFTQTIALGLYNLQGAYRPGEASYSLVLRMRLDADFGVNARLPPDQAGGETTYATPAGNGIRFLPGLEMAPVDLMVGYLEGKNLAHGLVSFRLGRQYLTDVLGFWSFDGGLLQVTTPLSFRLEAYGGLEQRGGLPLSTSRFEPQGVWRGSHRGFGGEVARPSVADYPSFLDSAPAPSFGVALETAGLHGLHSRLSFRRVYTTGAAFTTALPDGDASLHGASDTRIAHERLGYAAALNRGELGSVRGGIRYDLVAQRVANAFGSLDVYLGKRATVGADADYWVPTFDADSIWSVFTQGPTTTLTSRAALRFSRRVDLAASGGVRVWTAEGDPSPVHGGLSQFGAGECVAAARWLATRGSTLDCAMGRVYLAPGSVASYARDPSHRVASVTVDALGDVRGRVRWGAGEVSFGGLLQAGPRGRREGADLAGDMPLDGGRYTLGARVSLYGWSDPLRPERDATSLSYVLSAGFAPAQLATFRLEWEHDMNRLVGQRYRVLARVNLWVLP